VREVRSKKYEVRGVVAAACAVLALAAAPASLPRTPDGHPDLQGVWDNSSLTPLERPANLAGKEFFSDAEAADYESLDAYVERLKGRFGEPEGAVTGEANGIWRSPRRLDGLHRGREGDVAGARSRARDPAPAVPGFHAVAPCARHSAGAGGKSIAVPATWLK